ncbi:MAG: 4Fe-4S dicluster domain-containing protein [Actinobacteria bacterium]|nr:4Fe-4S dicluster domain-containing protein [Actinomycetota bacterium]
MPKTFSVFWGCTIPARFPFIEKSTRIAIAAAGGLPVAVEGYTCCPEGTLMKAMDEEAYYATAARNLFLADEAGVSIVTPCNGCYSTFKSVSATLRADWRLADRVADIVSEGEGHPREVSLPAVSHLAEWLYEELGPAAIAKMVQKPLWGMRVAVHYGCHLLRPSPAVRWDSSTNPTKLEDLVRALGATVVDYETKMDCCGGALDRVGERDSALDLCRNKLDDLTGVGVDALVVVCPSCLQQFDLNQASLLRGAEARAGLPVFYYSELFALTLGHEPDEIGLSMHRVSTEPFLEKWNERAAQHREIARDFAVTELQKCADCHACEEDCPVTKAGSGFSPTGIIGEILSGDIDGVIDRADLWKCLECYTCYERCHSRLGMAEVFRKLKELSAERGSVPAAVRSAYDMFLSTGSLGEPRESARTKLGLDPLPRTGGEELKKMLSARKAER